MKLNDEAILSACPALNEVQLNGTTDYDVVKKALIASNIQPKNSLVWAIIEMIARRNQQSADDFFC